MRSKRDIFDSLAVVRDDYKAKYELIMDGYNKELKKIEQNYRPSAPLYQKSKEEAKNDMLVKLDALRTTEKNFIDAEMAQIRALISAEITTFSANDSTTNNLMRLYNLPMSKCEITALAERYKDGNYWVKRIISDLAEKNGVSIDCFNDASAQVQLDVIDNLSERVNTFLTEWNGEKDSQYSARASLADSQLRKLERRFTNDYKDAEISSRKNVQIALTKASKHREVFKQAMSLQALYNNVDGEQKNYLFYELANATRIYQDSLRAADIDFLVEDFKNSKEYTKIDNAVKCADSLRLMQDVTQADIENKIAEHGGYSTYMKAELTNLYGSHNDNANKALEVAQTALNEA